MSDTATPGARSCGRRGERQPRRIRDHQSDQETKPYFSRESPLSFAALPAPRPDGRPFRGHHPPPPPPNYTAWSTQRSSKGESSGSCWIWWVGPYLSTSLSLSTLLSPQNSCHHCNFKWLFDWQILWVMATPQPNPPTTNATPAYSHASPPRRQPPFCPRRRRNRCRLR